MVPEHTLCLNFSEKLGTILSFVISVRAARTAENVVWATHLALGTEVEIRPRARKEKWRS